MKNDFIIYTDGSCWDKDGLGGASAVVRDCRECITHTKVLAENFTKVSRMEFSALLMGIELCFQLKGYTTFKNSEMARAAPIVINWFSDREDLVMSVDTLTTGYRRRANPDLEYFEPMINITPNYVGRNTKPLQALTDKIAGEQRAYLKNYIQSPTAQGLGLKP